MHLWRSAFLVKVTLFFFAVMLFFNPAYAQSGTTTGFSSVVLSERNELPVMVVSEEEARQLFGELQDKGYVVKEGTLAQLDQLTSGADKAEENNNEQEEIKCDEKVKKNKTKNNKQVSKQDAPGSKQSAKKPMADGKSDTEKNPALKKIKDKKCGAEQSVVETEQQKNNGSDVKGLPEHEHAPPPEHEHSPPQQYPESEVHGGVGFYANVSGGSGSGGNNRDFAKVFFIVAGFVVVAAFVVYVGKYIVDLAGGKDVTLWRELMFNSTFLSTDFGRRGQFIGAKLATGIVSDELIQLALVGEVGNANLNLVLNENTNPIPLNFSATYWMLGATARLHLSDKRVNASYLYLEFMGGTTSNSATGIIGASRLGASFGINDYLRLGASLGAQYIGLNKDQGFANDGDNYWVTYGVEIGARF